MVQHFGYEGGDFQVGITRTENGGFCAPTPQFADVLAGATDHSDPASFEDRILNTIDSRRGMGRARKRRQAKRRAGRNQGDKKPERYVFAPALPPKRYIMPTRASGVVRAYQPMDPRIDPELNSNGELSAMIPGMDARLVGSHRTAATSVPTAVPSSTKKRRRRNRRRGKKGPKVEIKAAATATLDESSAATYSMINDAIDDLEQAASKGRPPAPTQNRSAPTKNHRQRRGRKDRGQQHEKRQATERSAHVNRDGSVDRAKLYEMFPSLRRFAR